MKRVGKFLIILGTVILITPIIGGIYNQYQQQKMYEFYIQQQSKQSVVIEGMNQIVQEEQNRIDEVREAKGSGGRVNETPNGVEVIGLINLPKIDVQMMLVEGVTKTDLKYAAGHMPETALPGEIGNCSIAGHRSYTFGQYFNRLDELAIGDTIEIVYNNTRYTYEVYESFLVDPSQVEVIEPQGEREVVTLITCHPVVIATHRLIVRGELVEKVEL